jgi:hypothetical protein
MRRALKVDRKPAIAGMALQAHFKWSAGFLFRKRFKERAASWQLPSRC